MASDLPGPIVVVGPSGVGKSVLIKKMQELWPDKFGFSVSHTTRGPRPGEEDKVHYHFSDLETMQNEVDEGKFIEHANVHGNMYGTSKEAVEAVRQTGKICILDLDVQGAKSIWEQNIWDGTKFIFIMPPSFEELERRLRGRGTETEEKVQMRLANAIGEIKFSEQVEFFTYRFVMENMIGVPMPMVVLRFFSYVKQWYHFLGPLPAELTILEHFLQLDDAGTGILERQSVEMLLQELIPQVTSDEVEELLAPACREDGCINYREWVTHLFG